MNEKDSIMMQLLFKATSRLLILLTWIVLPSCQAFTTKPETRLLLRSSNNDIRVSVPRNNNPFLCLQKVEWEGSSYSSKIITTNQNKRNASITVDLAHCGAVPMEQQEMDNANRTGVALWSAAYSMADYIDQRCGVNDWDASGNNLTCLELGAGLGLPSIVAAKHGFDGWATEMDETVLPLLKKNVQANALENTVKVHTLDWNDDINAHPRDLVNSDLILASELIYKDTKPYWSALISFLRRLRVVSQRRQQQPTTGLTFWDGTPVQEYPLVLLGYTLRSRNHDLDEAREFFAMLRQNGFRVCPIPHSLVPNSENRVLTTLFELRWMD